MTRKQGCLWAALGCLSGAIVGFLALVVGIRMTFDSYRQASGSMEPTLVKGDVVLVRPAHDVARGDLIVFSSLDGRVVIKRVIGLPGETVALRDNHAIANGRELDEPYAAFIDASLPEIAQFRTMRPVTLEPDAYFVLGDNRDNSNDSRFIGPVKRQSIRGRVVFVLSQRNGAWRP